MDESPWVAGADARPWIGLDVGGANLKAADGRGRAVSRPFELWKRLGDLPAAIGELVASFEVDSPRGIALTMTGELADCFETKAEGVRAIVAATVEAVGETTVRVATVEDRWLTPERIHDEPLAIAAANWRLGARLAASAMETNFGLWIDVGSTTTDVIPFGNGRVATESRTDTDRLVGGELLYSGVGRTPVCAVVREVPYRGALCPVMAEWFATTADAWLVRGLLPEASDSYATADGRAFTRRRSIERLARCVGADRETFGEDDARVVAEAICWAQKRVLVSAIEGARAKRVVVSGSGEFLAAESARDAGVDAVSEVSRLVGRHATAAFPAHAAAMLASEELL